MFVPPTSPTSVRPPPESGCVSVGGAEFDLKRRPIMDGRFGLVVATVELVRSRRKATR